MLKIDSNYSGINVNLEFEEGLNVFSGSSGEGKTFMFKIIEAYCIENTINYIYFNMSSAVFTEDQIIAAVENKEVILFDNADLYLTDKILEVLNQHIVVIISIKDDLRLNLMNTARYELDYNNQVMMTKRVSI